MLYEDYLLTLSRRVDAALSTIEANHNFEFGPEFEIAICKVLRAALPDRYGVCRGYLVSTSGETAGDDIVIYEQTRFPTLHLRDREDYSRKEHVPLEAAYCYIETKHTINLAGEDGQSLSKATSQVAAAKLLALKRESVTPGQISPYLNLDGSIFGISAPSEFPPIQNPLFGVVLARYVRDKHGGTVLGDGEAVNRAVAAARIPDRCPPDLMVLGNQCVVLPVIPKPGGNGKLYRSAFHIDGKSELLARPVEDIAFGIGIASIMAALDWMQVGRMPWHDILVDGLGIPK